MAIKFSYKTPKDETIGMRGEIIEDTKKVSFADATTEDLIEELKRLETKYDLDITITLKLPKG